MPRLLVLLLLLGVLPPGAGCAGREPAPGEPATFTDDLGRTVSIPAPIDRVISLAPNLTEMVFTAGAGDRLVGVTTADDYPPAVDTLPRFSALPMDFEAVAALRPDLVLATDQINTPRDAETFAALNLPVFFFSFATLEDVLENLRMLGALLGTERRAEAAADSLQARLDALRERTAALEARPSVLFLIGDETLFSFGEGSYIHDVIALAGGRSLTAGLESAAPVLREEFVLTARPDVIVGTFGEGYTTARLLERHPTWEIVPAVRTGRVYSVPPALFSRPGPRLVEGAWHLAALLHPAPGAPSPSSPVPSR